MGSKIDRANMKNGNSEVEANFNQEQAESQRTKNVFRAHRVALSADPYNPSRLDNAIQHRLLDN